MVLPNHAGVPVGRAGPRNHHLGLDLDMHADLPSLLQSNYAGPGLYQAYPMAESWLARLVYQITRMVDGLLGAMRAFEFLSIPWNLGHPFRMVLAGKWSSSPCPIYRAELCRAGKSTI